MKEELDLIQKSEIGDKTKTTNDIELDVKSICPFFVDRMEGEIDSLEKALENKIHAITTKVEKDLLEEKIRVEKSEELKDAEVEIALGEIEDEVFGLANKEAANMQDDVEVAEGKLEEGIRKELNKFLVKEKKFSETDGKETREKILSSLDDELTDLINKVD